MLIGDAAPESPSLQTNGSLLSPALSLDAGGEMLGGVLGFGFSRSALLPR